MRLDISFKAAHQAGVGLEKLSGCEVGTGWAGHSLEPRGIDILPMV